MSGPSQNSVRLNKYLSVRAGLSRRQADQMIKNGKIFVNGKKVLHPAVFVNPDEDSVRWNRRNLLTKKPLALYFLLNKPAKTLSTTHDPKGRPVVMDYIPKLKERVFPVGRLDWDTEGLLLFTNDGDFSSKVLRPENQIPKTYLVKVRGAPSSAQIKRLVQGLSTPVGRRRALFAKKIPGKAAGSSWIKVIVSEGKKRQIRLMFDKIGFPVQKLRRTAIGRLKMNKLAKGAVLRLREKDVKKVFQKPKELMPSKGR